MYSVGATQVFSLAGSTGSGPLDVVPLAAFQGAA